MDEKNLADYNEEIHVQYNLTEQEYVRAFQSFRRLSKGSVRVAVATGSLVCLGLLLILLSSYMAGGFALGAALVFIALWSSTYYRAPALQYRKDPRFSELVEYWVSAEGVRAHTDVVDSRFKWRAFEAFWESGDLFVLQRTGQLFTAIPKRAFVEPGSEERFRQLLRHQIVPRPQLQPARPTLISRRPSSGDAGAPPLGTRSH